MPMFDKIYVITKGEYSDKYNVGYFTDLNDAMRYCECENNKRDSDNDYRYEELECINNRAVRDSTVMHIFTATFRTVMHSMGYQWEFTDIKYRGYTNEERTPEINIGNNVDIDHPFYASITMTLKESDMGIAKKALIGRFYKFLAERSGL